MVAALGFRVNSVLRGVRTGAVFGWGAGRGRRDTTGRVESWAGGLSLVGGRHAERLDGEMIGGVGAFDSALIVMDLSPSSSSGEREDERGRRLEFERSLSCVSATSAPVWKTGFGGALVVRYTGRGPQLLKMFVCKPVGWTLTAEGEFTRGDVPRISVWPRSGKAISAGE